MLIYFMPSRLFVFLSHLVPGEGFGIRLYRFRIIALFIYFSYYACLHKYLYEDQRCCNVVSTIVTIIGETIH